MNKESMPASWQVKTLLDTHNLSTYRLAQELSGRVSRNSVYAIAAGTAKRADLETIGALVEALRSLTGNQTLGVGDLLEYEAVSSKPVNESELMAVGADDLRAQLEELEADTSPDQLKSWVAAFEVPV